MQDNIDKNLKKGRNYITISYFIGAMLFLFAYIHQTELWLLIVAILLLIATIVSIYIFNNLKALFFGSPNDPDETDEPEEEVTYDSIKREMESEPTAYNKVYAHDEKPVDTSDKFTPLAVINNQHTQPKPAAAVPEAKIPTQAKPVEMQNPTAPAAKPAAPKAQPEIRTEAQKLREEAKPAPIAKPEVKSEPKPEPKPFSTNYNYNSDEDDKIEKNNDEKDDIENYY